MFPAQLRRQLAPILHSLLFENKPHHPAHGFGADQHLPGDLLDRPPVAHPPQHRLALDRRPPQLPTPRLLSLPPIPLRRRHFPPIQHPPRQMAHHLVPRPRIGTCEPFDAVARRARERRRWGGHLIGVIRKKFFGLTYSFIAPPRVIPKEIKQGCHRKRVIDFHHLLLAPR